jgi:hypothetical protein
MIPLRLQWRVPIDGVEVVANQVFRARSAQFREENYTVADLEKPFAVRLANCKTIADHAKFIRSYGFPGSGEEDDIETMARLSEEMEQSLEICGASAIEKLEHARELVNRIDYLKPAIELDDDHDVPRLVTSVITLAELMRLEVIFAFEVGASFQRCEHCGSGFLTGPTTKRRSSSKFCDDRCRVAALRRRNAAQAGH